jgi:hypothetical protein
VEVEPGLMIKLFTDILLLLFKNPAAALPAHLE